MVPVEKRSGIKSVKIELILISNLFVINTNDRYYNKLGHLAFRAKAILLRNYGQMNINLLVN